jgi:7-carboxy-7-deazaguanine synthase
MCGRNRLENIPLLTPHDEVKFVMCSREDYEWARDRLSEFALPSRVRAVLFSAAFGKLPLSQLAEWILEDRLPVRFQLQLHKYIWEPSQRGV